MWNNKDVMELIGLSEQYFKKRNREICFYISDATEPFNLGTKLIDNGFGVFEEEAWMFFNWDKRSLIKAKQDVMIQEITSESIELFKKVYRTTLPGPEVEEYIKCVVDGFLYVPPLVTVKYYIGYIESKPVGMLSLLVFEQYAGLYAIATDENYQRRGVCTTLLDTALTYCENQEIDTVFLQTVKDGESLKVFEKLGFKTEFLRIGYAKQELLDTMEHG